MNSESPHSISEENSWKIVNLSFFCMLLVCIVHVQWRETTEIERTLVYLVKYVICGIGVPFFFAVSGFFLARHMDEPGWWKAAIQKRMGTLLVPYCVWQLINAFVWLAIEHRWTLRPGGFGLNPFIWPKLVPLWYLRTLMIFVVASPLLFWALKRWGRGVLAALFVANLVVGAFSAIGMIPAQSRVGGLVYYTFSVLGLLYFLAGACLARHPITLSRRAGNICGVVSLVVIAIQMTIFCLGVVIPFDFRVFLLPTLLAFLWTRTPTTRLPRVLAQAIFPIYLMHVIIYDALENLVFSPETFGGFAMLFSGVGFSIVLSALLHRFLPRLAHLVFGGR